MSYEFGFGTGTGVVQDGVGDGADAQVGGNILCVWIAFLHPM